MPSTSRKESRSSTTSRSGGLRLPESATRPVQPVSKPGSNGGDGEARSERVAAIDIGSNSVRQIVADVAPDGAIRVVDEMRAHPRLGAGLTEGGALAEDAMRAAVEKVAHMVTLARQIGASKIEAVATSAVRDATNADAFVDLVRDQTGINVRVLS